MDVTEINKPTVCIVRLMDETVNPNVLFQVTINPANVSPSEAYMRFGEAGDEIMGWKRIDALQLVEVLGWPSETPNIYDKAPKPEPADIVKLAGEVA